MLSFRLLSTGMMICAALTLAPSQLQAQEQDHGIRDTTSDRNFVPSHLLAAICGMPGHHDSEMFKRRVQLVKAIQERRGIERATSAAPPIYNWLGELSYPITTFSPATQQYFDQGLRLSYAFNHPEALRAFRRAQDLDPDCAMCYWGEAYALGPNINAPMDPAAVEPAVAAIGKAEQRSAGVSEREQILIRALAKRYSAHPGSDQAVLNEAYAGAMGEIAARHPDDPDIQALYADALMNLSPWAYWESDGQTPMAHVAALVPTLEKALAANPKHPYAIHLYIHAVEASSDPKRAEAYADRLAATMPGAGHVVHMPGHIYFRTGRFIDSIASNHAAVSADEYYMSIADPDGWYQYSYYPHNVHFLLESARMAGDAETALEASSKLPDVIPDEVAHALPWVEIIKAAPYFAHAQFSAPDDVMSLPDPGDVFPYVRAMWHYARGVAEAMRGDTAAARAEAAWIAQINDRTDWTHMIGGGVPSPNLLRLAGSILDGRIAMANDDADAAVNAFRTAAEIQDGLPYLEPPYWYYPVRQSLGAALLKAGMPEEAAREFRAALVSFPNNAWGLYGLMQAQKAQGDESGAAETEKMFREAWAGGALSIDLARL
jgi:tetratricopeptide (TPR) repeat protein